MAFIYRIGFWVGKAAGKGKSLPPDPRYWADGYADVDYVEGDND